MDKPKVKTYVHNRTVSVSAIRIPRAFQNSPPSAEKVEQCLAFYLDNGYFDREIILTDNNFLVDGYIKYLIVAAAGEEKVKVLQVHTEITYPEVKPEPIKRTFWQRVFAHA